MMIFLLAGFVAICGLIIAAELICRVWEAMERRTERRGDVNESVSGL